MIDINWKRFELKNPKATESFENMCYFLFCRRYGITEGIRTDFNQVGLETEPIKNSMGKYCGFQSKFFEKGIDYNQIEHSIDKSLDAYENLDYVIIYLNQEARTSCKSAVRIEEKCKKKGVTIEWFLPNNFKIALNQPNNLDLAQFYFGEMDILGFISDSKSIRMSTVLQSREYIELKVNSLEKTQLVTECANEIIKSNKKIYLLSGAAGTGKSICMCKLLHIYGGIDEDTKENQIKKIESIGAIPIFINLNNIALENLENIVLEYRKKVSNGISNNKYIYLFDGLDEVPRVMITSTLLFLEELLGSDATNKVIISSRISSYNKYILRSNIKNIIEYKIMNIGVEEIHYYFKNKFNEEKIKKLSKLECENPKFIRNVKDVLTVSLLWSHIDKINSTTSLINFIKYSINEIIGGVYHKKYLETLNLPYPKEDAVIELNKKISFSLFEKDTVSVSYSELYNIVEKYFPKCDYDSLNNIVGYIIDSFFDVNSSNDSYSYTYQHKRFMEYFVILELESIFSNDLNYLRTHNIVVNNELFEKMLVPYLKNKAQEKKDLSLAFMIGLINVYLGNDRAWGVDNSFYFWSDWITYAIASQVDEVFEDIIEDESLPFNRFFRHIPEGILKHLSSTSIKLRYNDELRYFFKSYLSLISMMHKLNKHKYLVSMLENYDEIMSLASEKKFYYNTGSERDNNLVWRNITYIDIVIKQNDFHERMETILSKSKKVNIDNLFKGYIEIDLLYLSSLYYNVILYKADKCTEIINKMNLNQLSVFAIALAKPECIKFLFVNKVLRQVLEKKLHEEIKIKTLSGVINIVLKNILGIKVSKNEFKIVSEFLCNTKLLTSSIFWKEHCDTVAFILYSFDEKDFLSSIEIPIKKYVDTYSLLIDMIKNTCSITKFVKFSINNVVVNSEVAYYIKILIGKALALTDNSDIDIIGAIAYINRIQKDGSVLIIYHIMKLLNPIRYRQLISASDLNKLDTNLVYKDIDYTSTSECMFMLSFILSEHNSKRSYELLLNGISNGILRMNDRKDTIGDYRLIDSLEVFLKNNWISDDILKGYLKRILNITNIMNQNNIENDTHSMVMKLLNKYNFGMAEFYYKTIVSKKEVYNLIHLDHVLARIYRGIDVSEVERCLENLTADYDRYHEKIDSSYFYYKIKAYLRISNSDLYTDLDRSRYFKKACKEIDSMDYAGWGRELNTEEYEIYDKLFLRYGNESSITKRKEITVQPKGEKKELVDVLSILKQIKTREALDEFFTQLKSNYSIDTFEVNELLIDKCFEIYGDIEMIFNLFEKSYYPGNMISFNSHNFWMTVVVALRNIKSKNDMIEFLINSGGGHDGFSELIKIYGFIGDKYNCIKAFDSLIRCIEFLLC
ncbi:hypothetical protein SAMN02745196_02320 [Clostridium collagenovorans DSM 3089]|uniref:NACHT domain-containing protein n=1 Tax=Clostridium collagenovorans DSM 3089 TaxID=1121306 RepID=A0A1M5XP40_9CLOT|nr:hypothetical protein [Clostridium collagenovorans]SHI01033.1 hypothetical protein SAMN02745196_02320 [Clostridium collagenovorans DSM 3089]